MASRQVFGQPASVVSDAVAAHAAAGDPHPTYLTATEGNAAYAATGHTHAGSTVRIGGPTYVTAGTVGGDTNPNTSGAWAQLTAVGEVAVAAAAGNYVECVASFLADASTSAFYDLAVKVTGALVWYASSGTNTPATEGDPALYPSLRPQGAAVASLIVQAGHLDGGSVHFVLAIKSNATGKTYYSTSYPFRWRAVNYGTPA